MGRVQYPLTPEAKQAARYLVEAWDGKLIEQEFVCYKTYPQRGVEKPQLISGQFNSNFRCPPVRCLNEISLFNLINLGIKYVGNDPTTRYHILLMQELRNAVENDFEVSDYFLTFNAVGTIINAAEGSTVDIHWLQSIAEMYGGTMIGHLETSPELAHKIVTTLGQDTLRVNPEIAEVVDKLGKTSQDEQPVVVGQLISELGHRLSKGKDTENTLRAIAIAIKFLYDRKT